jgi:membrane fusion protein (multidrug efflux system)
MSNVALKIPNQPQNQEPVRQEPARLEAVRPAPTTQAAPVQPAAPKKSNRARYIRFALLAVALATAAYYGNDYWQVGRFQISTDDAYVQADMSLVGNKLAGYVKDLPFADNAQVKAGDVILRLDSIDYELALTAAKARVETQKAIIATTAQQVLVQQAQIKAAEGQLANAQANEQTATIVQARASELLKSKVGNQQTMDTTTGALQSARASVDVAQANIEAAKAQIGILNAQANAATHQLDELNIAVTKAQNDLTYTEIKAPFDGIIANRAVEPGQFIGAGSRLMALVPVQNSYIQANFKETQLADIHPGQKAVIIIDALKGEKFEGVVQSVAPASGAQFSLLPPENATGNFTKITQRVPVKITVPPELATKLRPGLSVNVSVDMRDIGK